MHGCPRHNVDIVTGLEARFQTSYYEKPSNDPGLVIGQDGQVSVIVGGQRIPVTGGGGSGNVQMLSVPIAHDTPGILTDGNGGGGIDILTPGGIAVGDLILFPSEFSALSIDTPWNGSTPSGWLYGGTPYTGGGIQQTFNPANLTQTNQLWDSNDTNGSFLQAAEWNTGQGWIKVVNLLTKLRFVIDDGSGGDPGSTQGAGAITYARVRGLSV